MTALAPPGWPVLIPRLITDDVAGLVNFAQQVFGAEGDIVAGRPVELRIADSMIMVSDGGEIREKTSAFLYIYVDDADAVFDRAMKLGASILEAPTDTPYGDRRATIRDPWSNIWQIATMGGNKDIV